MNDILLKPEDTGEIPRTDPGQKTMNLAPYAAGLPPAMRRPEATGEIPLVAFQGPQPKPRPILKPSKVDDRPLSVGEEIVWDAEVAYVGRHRAPEDMPADVLPGRFGGLRSVLATAWARVWSAR